MLVEKLFRKIQHTGFYSGLVLLNPKGPIALQEKNLLITATLLMLIVIIPVFVLTAFFAWQYRAGNKKARYMPNWEHNTIDELIWWAVPTVIVAILGTLAWSTTHALDPYKPLQSTVQPVTIQVVALNWKWLFIYPKQGIATVNYIVIPEDTPINFQITSDAPMNSFWIPQLGGQIYAMAGMVTKLHLQADEPGNYSGLSANFSGKGFAEMKFTAHATSQSEFTDWVNDQKHAEPLDMATYVMLASPSEHVAPATYSIQNTQLFSNVVAKYMHQPSMSSDTMYHH